jgi:hypothetical protein
VKTSLKILEGKNRGRSSELFRFIRHVITDGGNLRFCVYCPETKC